MNNSFSVPGDLTFSDDDDIIEEFFEDNCLDRLKEHIARYRQEYQNGSRQSIAATEPGEFRLRKTFQEEAVEALVGIDDDYIMDTIDDLIEQVITNA